MIKKAVYSAITRPTRDLPVDELLQRRRTAWKDIEQATESNFRASNPLTRFAGELTLRTAELRFEYYHLVIESHEDYRRILNGELGQTTEEIGQALGIEEDVGPWLVECTETSLKQIKYS